MEHTQIHSQCLLRVSPVLHHPAAIITQKKNVIEILIPSPYQRFPVTYPSLGFARIGKESEFTPASEGLMGLVLLWPQTH